MNNKRLAQISAACTVALGWGGAGCLSMQSQTSLDQANTSSVVSNQPYVEAYVEYAGPQAKWAGPSSFIVHVTAKDAGPAQVTMTPALIPVTSGSIDEPGQIAPGRRAPASSGLSQAARPKSFTSEEARSELAHLANALQGVQAPFHGCMSPVRVRLVRADGGILERQGCRSEMGWSRAVSDSVSGFIEVAITGHSPSQLMPTQPVVQPAGTKTAQQSAPAAVEEGMMKVPPAIVDPAQKKHAEGAARSIASEAKSSPEHAKEHSEHH